MAGNFGAYLAGVPANVRRALEELRRQIEAGGGGGGGVGTVFTTTDDGLAPASGAEVGKFLRDDATWQYPPASPFLDGGNAGDHTGGGICDGGGA